MITQTRPTTAIKLPSPKVPAGMYVVGLLQTNGRKWILNGDEKLTDSRKGN